MLYKTFRMVIILILALASVHKAHGAGIPHMMNYQGELTDPNGESIHDPNLPIAFTFYDAPADGNNLFSETYNVDVNNGFFDLLIGSVSGPKGIPESVFAGPDVYLGIRVGGDSEMIPRQRVASVAFAYRSKKANDAELLGGRDASEFALSVHDHSDRYYTRSEMDSLFYAKAELDPKLLTSFALSVHDHNDRYYTKSEIDSLFYTKAELDPKLLTSSEKSELTGGEATSLHYHSTGQLEAWPTFEIGSTSGSSKAGSWELIGHHTFSKVPKGTIFRTTASCRIGYAGQIGQDGIRIVTTVGTKEHYPDVKEVYLEYEDLWDCSSLADFSRIDVRIYLKGRYDNGLGSTYGGAVTYAQQNAL